MRIKQLITHSNLSQMKNKILPTCLQGNYGDSLGEFSNASYFVFGAERGKTAEQKTKLSMACGKENILLNAGRLHSHVDIIVLSGAK